MRFNLFRNKKSESPARFEQDSALTEELERRIEAIRFRPKNGFLKDQQQPKKSGRGAKDLTSIVPARPTSDR